MPILTTVLATLTIPIAKFLLKAYIGELPSEIGGGLVDVAKTKMSAFLDQREAQRQFERLGERIVIRLLPLFQRAEHSADIDVQKVLYEIAYVLEGRISADLLIEKDLDPGKLAAYLRGLRPSVEQTLTASELRLYHMALDETVRYLVEMAAQLPSFDARVVANGLQRLGRMGADLEEVLNTTQRIEQGVHAILSGDTRFTEDEQRYEADYRQAVIRNLDHVELFGADIRPEARRQALSVAYISLNARRTVSPGGESSAAATIDAVLNTLQPEGGRLLIRGEAGSGKSTIFRWAAVEAAGLRVISSRAWFRHSAGRALVHRVRQVLSTTPALELGLNSVGEDAWQDKTAIKGRIGDYGGGTSLHGWRTRIPFFIRLRDCTGGKLPRPSDFPTYIAKEIGNPPETWVMNILRQGRALVLLDGVDEVPNAHRPNLRNEIEAIVKAYPKNYFLLSTRPTAVPDGWLAGIGFREATVEPMSEADKAAFIHRWHDAVSQELARQGSHDESLQDIAAELIEKLPDNPSVSRLATNPLLCAMICALHRERNRNLPESQTELCEAICHMLLHRREQEGGLRMEEFPEAYRRLSYKQKRSIVRDMAHYMVRNEEPVLTASFALARVTDTLRLFPGHQDADPEEVLYALIERSGVLRESRPGAIDFIHNTVKEFLAAEQFVEDHDIGLLSRVVTDPAWQPVVLFAVATDRKDFATKLVGKLLADRSSTDPENGPAIARAKQLFALRVRNTALYLDPAIESDLLELQGRLFPPRTMADAEALASSGESVIEYLRYRRGLAARTAAACIRTLRLIGTHKAQARIKEYLQDRRKAVVGELIYALNPLLIDTIRERLLSEDMLEDSICRQITDLEPIRGLVQEVTTISLNSCQITNIDVLADAGKLQHLSLTRTYISDVEPLGKLTSLIGCGIAYTNVADLGPFRAHANLKMLDASITPTKDLTPLANLRELEALWLIGCPISKIDEIADLPKLNTLYVDHTHLTDISAVSSLKSLQNLDFSSTGVSDLSPITALKGLESLDCSQCPVTEISSLAQVRSLQSVNLSQTQVRDLRPLCDLPNLKKIQVVGVPAEMPLELTSRGITIVE
jgi:hypothetical protein